MRYISFLLLAVSASSLSGQSPRAQTFEVASIKLDPNQNTARSMEEVTLPPVRVLPGGRVESYGYSLRNLIASSST